MTSTPATRSRRELRPSRSCGIIASKSCPTRTAGADGEDRRERSHPEACERPKNADCERYPEPDVGGERNERCTRRTRPRSTADTAMAIARAPHTSVVCVRGDRSSDAPTRARLPASGDRKTRRGADALRPPSGARLNASPSLSEERHSCPRCWGSTGAGPELQRSCDRTSIVVGAPSPLDGGATSRRQGDAGVTKSVTSTTTSPSMPSLDPDTSSPRSSGRKDRSTLRCFCSLVLRGRDRAARQQQKRRREAPDQPTPPATSHLQVLPQSRQSLLTV